VADGVFELSQAARQRTLLPALRALTEHHRARCEGYRRILAATGHSPGRRYAEVADLPWLPTRLFKQHTLHSVDPAAVYRVLTSSGTTGTPSRITVDRAAARAQQHALAATMRTVLGTVRLPMLVIDSRKLLEERTAMSARSAGVRGMMTFGRDHVFALDEREMIDRGAVESFLRAHGGAPFLVFGFTFMVWLHLYALARERPLDLSKGILIHSGGWKKLAERAVDSSEFRKCLAREAGLVHVHNFYGMVEQMGTVFLEGPSGGSLYCPDFADVIVRDPVTWNQAPVGQPGVVEVVSTLRAAHPGHLLLTEDIGVVHGVDDGDWPGTRFSILGRLPQTEVRGCGDAYPDEAR
jgi:hypothetical protein